MEQHYKYFAFISYNSKDTEWGKRIQKKLENYRMPSTLCSAHGLNRNPIKPIFFAPTDIQPGQLTDELQQRLRASRNMIVICSPNSANSEWVGKEIEFFHQLGRTNHIYFFIVDGVPHSGNPNTECFNPIIDELDLPEILGANIHEKIYRWPWMNKERAYVQLISKLLGVEFDAIWQRHKRSLINKVIAWSLGIIAILLALFGTWSYNQPVDVEIKLNEISVENNNLPPLENAVVTITLDDNSMADTIHTLDAAATFPNISHHFINNKVRITVKCQNFITTDTIIQLSENVSINVRREPEVFGRIRFKLWNPDKEQTAAYTEVNIDGHSVTSDADGYVSLSIPLAEQKTTYPISSSAISLIDHTITLPCGPDDIIIYK
jgi:hypothetical protein